MLRDCEMLNWKLYQAQRSSPQTCRHKYENTTEARWIAAERFYEWKLWCICEHSMERRERNPTSQSWGSKPHRMWKIDEREFTQSGALAELLRLYASRERLSTIFSTFSWMNLEIQTLLTPETHHRRPDDVIRLLARDTRIIHVARMLPGWRVSERALYFSPRCWWLYLNILL